MFAKRHGPTQGTRELSHNKPHNGRGKTTKANALILREPSLTGMVVQAYHVRASRGAGVLSPMIGTILGHYRVVRKFSGGGMCILRAAEDLRPARRLAIQLIQNVFGSERESMFLDSAGHPHSRMLLLRSK